MRDRRVVLRDRRRRITYDEQGVHEKWGVAPTSIPDLLKAPSSATAPMATRGIAGWGAGRPPPQSCCAVRLDRRNFRGAPPNGPHGTRGAPRPRGAIGLNGVAEVQLYLDLALLRADADIPQRDPAELRWDGVPRARFEAFCGELGLDSLRDRPSRWRAD